MSVTVEFSNVGRGNKSWTAQVSEFTESAVIRAVRKGGALASRGIDVDYDGESNTGTIFVGGLRAVGTFRILKEKQ